MSGGRTGRRRAGETEAQAGPPQAVNAETQPWLAPRPGGVAVRVRVVPRAALQRIGGVLGDRLKVQIHAAPVEGEANRALAVVLAEAAGLPPSAVSLVSGAKDRSKTVFLRCEEPARVVRRLMAAARG